MGFFSRRALYKFVSTLEILFGLLILSFSINLVFIVDNYNSNFDESKNSTEYQHKIINQIQKIKYSAIAGIVESLIQILAGIYLVLKSKLKIDLDGKRIEGDYKFVPLLWLIINGFLLGALAFMFVFPLGFTMSSNDKEFEFLTTGLKEYYTYTVCSGLFKILFIWIVITTIKKRGDRTKKIDSPPYEPVAFLQSELVHNSKIINHC